MRRRTRQRDVAHNLAFELWAASIDDAYALRLEGDTVTGHLRLSGTYSWGSSHTGALDELPYMTDVSEAEKWERIRRTVSSDWKCVERVGPEAAVPAVAALRVSRAIDRTRSTHLTVGVVLLFAAAIWLRLQ